MISIKNVKKCFASQSVLDGVNLKVGAETVGLLGSNGAGKTTLLKCILGLLEFDGEILVNGINIKLQPLEAKKKIAYIPQSFPLWNELKVSESMRFFCQLRKVTEKRGLSLLEEFGLTAHKNKLIQALSGGMKQKLSIAIALLSEPEVVLLDEPTTSLDAWATNEILSILKSWKGKKTVLLSSHRIEEVRSVSHRLVEIRDGKLITPKVENLELSSEKLWT
jgi:ABC-type multidrug transport system ATPase subunit